jgi:hypothetical protein
LRRFARRGLVAALFWSSSAEDVRQRQPSCLCFLWPECGPQRPLSSSL